MNNEQTVMIPQTDGVQPEAVTPPEAAPMPAPEAENPAPKTENPAPETAELTAMADELAQYRAREERRIRCEQTRALLTQQGLDPAFAEFLTGRDDDESRRSVEAFARCWTHALHDEVLRRLPSPVPADYAQSPSPRPRRGIRRM